MKIGRSVAANDILCFFSTSQRENNDAINKIREKILPLLVKERSTAEDFTNHEKYGKYWKLVSYEWNCAVDKIALQTDIPDFTSISINVLGGRKHNHDANIHYYNGETIVGMRKIEFKSGCTDISKLPQFLSIPAKGDLFPKSYSEYWYENFMDKYIACDTEITEAKPSLQTYLKNVGSTDTRVSPFFSQLKSRESYFKEAKNDVVNVSISEYLETHGKDINLDFFFKKIKTSQTDKIFVMWSQQCHTFGIDMFLDCDMNDMTFHSIKNGNAVQIQSGNTIYSLLLRWRNHKGILNPAWQISMKRI